MHARAPVFLCARLLEGAHVYFKTSSRLVCMDALGTEGRLRPKPVSRSFPHTIVRRRIGEASAQMVPLSSHYLAKRKHHELQQGEY